MANRYMILIVDDEEDIRKFLSAALTNAGYAITEAKSAYEALKWVENKVPDLIILDLGLPDKDGKEVLFSLRQWSNVPIIVLSARDQEGEKILALEAGADDYLTKPFGTGELLARIKVALRHGNRVSGESNSIYTYNDLTIDPQLRKVILKGEEIRLTPTEYKLLSTLAKQPGKVITQSALINAVWGKNSQGNSHYLRIYVQHLREKLNDDPLKQEYIITEPGIGYRLSSD